MKIAFLFLMALSSKVYAFDISQGPVSAYRPLHKDYSYYESRFGSADKEMGFTAVSAIRAARYFSPSITSDVTTWISKEEMQERFEAIRDERFLTTNTNPDFPRRISWLYPKDGCYARAAMFNRNAFRMFIPIPNKVFAFGNLRMKTPNSVRGVVGWWYHVAPIVQVDGEQFVLDPSIDHEKPLTLKEWLSRMGTPSKIKVAVCGSGTYYPGDRCDKKTDGMELRAERELKHYLSLEERELRRLGRDPETELGDVPPWK